MTREQIARELDKLSCTLDQLSHRLERLANEVDPKLKTPRKATQ